MAISDSRVINIREQVTPTPSETRDFDKALFLFTPPDSSEIDELIAGSSVKSYANLDQVAEDWVAGSDPYTAASIWFQQTPFPGQFATAAHVPAGRDGTLVGATATGTRAEIQALTAFTFGGADVTVDLSSATAPSDVATAVATGVNAISGLTGVTVTAGGSDTLPATGASSINLTVTVPVAATTVTGLNSDVGFAGADADALGLVTGARYATPLPVSADVATSLTRALGIDDTPYWIYLANPINTEANRASASTWAEDLDVLYGFDTDETDVLSQTDTTSSAAIFVAAELKHTYAFYSQYSDYKAVAMGAVFSGRNNYNVANGTIQGSHRSLIGCQPDRQLTDFQAGILIAKRVNLYDRVIGGNSVIFGYTFGSRIDSEVGAAWIVENIQVAGVNLLRSAGRVPLTEVGTSLVVATITDVCERGRFNGIVASSGQLTPLQTREVGDAIGNPSFRGFLDRGYIVAAGPQSTADVGSRTTPAIVVKVLDSRGTDKVLVSLQVL